MDKYKRVFRSRRDRMVAGVCGGIAEYFDVDPTLIRLLWVAAIVFGFGSGLIIYIICAIVIPEMPPNYHHYEEDDMEVYDEYGNKVDGEFKKKRNNY